MRRSQGRFLFSLFVLASLYLSLLIGSKNYTTYFIAFLTFGWHAVAYWGCSYIASYRFKKSNAKYIEIKNEVLRKIFVRPYKVSGVYSSQDGDIRANIIGLVLNIINILLFLAFEVLLFMPKIPCDTYVFTLRLGARPSRSFGRIELILNSYNEVIAAEAPIAFLLFIAVVFFVFFVLFERQLKEHRKSIKRNCATTSPKKALKKIEWYYPLYTSLINISARRNNKKHKFYYKISQLEEIEYMVKAASENAELKLNKKDGKLFSFTVFDKFNEHAMFTGLFVK